jgi:uncharacterized protein (UPF0335 family)
MPKRNKSSEAERQPTDLNELGKLVNEFVDRFSNVENEIELLKEDQKNLIEEYSDKLDIKTLRQALRAANIKKKVDHKDTFDAFVDILEKRNGF